MNRVKKVSQLIFLYFFILSLGFWVSYHWFGYDYYSDTIYQVMIYFEMVLGSIAFVYYKKLNLRTLSQSFTYSNWIFPYIIAIYLIFDSSIFTGDFSVKRSILLILIFTSLFMGWSEELIFRGILVPLLKEKYSVTLSIFISALLFSLFQLIHLFGGVSLDNICIQMVYAFISSINFACLMILINNVLPLILYRFLWHFCLISAQVIHSEAQNLITGALFLELIILIPLFLFTIKKEKEPY